MKPSSPICLQNTQNCSEAKAPSYFDRLTMPASGDVTSCLTCHPVGAATSENGQNCQVFCPIQAVISWTNNLKPRQKENTLWEPNDWSVHSKIFAISGSLPRHYFSVEPALRRSPTSKRLQVLHYGIRAPSLPHFSDTLFWVPQIFKQVLIFV